MTKTNDSLANTPSTMTIMLVEDDDMIRELLSAQLAKIYRIEAFPDAETALERAREHEFDLVLMDISMPGMGGVKAVSILRTIPGYATLPILAMSGYTTPEDDARFRAAGFDGLVKKPFTPRQLLETVKSHAPD